MDYLKLFSALSKNIFIDEPMKNHTSFKIGGNADCLIAPSSEEELVSIISLCHENNLPLFIMGNGSNLLVGDKGIRGVTVKLAKAFSDYYFEDNMLCACSGALLSTLANAAAKNSLSGMEFAAGIPGTVGGAVYMNAGAYGGEMAQIVKKVQYFDGTELKETEDFDFSYRHSIFSQNGGIITKVFIELQKGKKEDILKCMEELNAKRRDKQPLNFPSAGSAFKRPEGDYAARLIECAGLKGKAIGGACVSEKHAGFIVNTGSATACDVFSLIEFIQKTVFEKFNIKLSPEIKYVGE